MIFNLRDRLVTDNERELRNIALVIAAQADRIFEAADRVETNLIEHFAELGVATSDDFERKMSGYRAHLLLKDKIVGLPHVGTFTLVNAQGRVFNFSRVVADPGDRRDGPRLLRSAAAERRADHLFEQADTKSRHRNLGRPARAQDLRPERRIHRVGDRRRRAGQHRAVLRHDRTRTGQLDRPLPPQRRAAGAPSASRVVDRARHPQFGRREPGAGRRARRREADQPGGSRCGADRRRASRRALSADGGSHARPRRRAGRLAQRGGAPDRRRGLRRARHRCARHPLGAATVAQRKATAGSISSSRTAPRHARSATCRRVC